MTEPYVNVSRHVLNSHIIQVKVASTAFLNDERQSFDYRILRFDVWEHKCPEETMACLVKRDLTCSDVLTSHDFINECLY